MTDNQLLFKLDLFFLWSRKSFQQIIKKYSFQYFGETSFMVQPGDAEYLKWKASVISFTTPFLNISNFIGHLISNPRRLSLTDAGLEL